jgi:uncharacterized MAPEG superfamily protein
MNAWEALTVFGLANLAAFMVGLEPDGNWSLAAMIWVGARAAHGVAYIANIAPVRLLSFATGGGMSFWIFAQALNA